MYSNVELRNGLKTRTFGQKLYIFESIDSTNTCAKTLANAGTDEGAVVFAEHQTSGRGRFGRTWHSETGSNLLFSLIIRPVLGSRPAARQLP